jgi:NADH-quinone oxidoreductase subunit G
VQIWHRKPEWKLNALDQRRNARIERVTPLDNPAVNGPWICNKGRDLAKLLERPRALYPMIRGREVDLADAVTAARALIDTSQHAVALVSSWASNEELRAFDRRLGDRFAAYVKADHVPAPGEVVEDDFLLRADKNPNTTGARELFPALAESLGALSDPVLLLVWGEGFRLADAAAAGSTIVLGSFAHPDHARADVFIPLSVQTERAGHYTNFQGTVSAFSACFRRPATVVDAEALFAALAERVAVTA